MLLVLLLLMLQPDVIVIKATQKLSTLHMLAVLQLHRCSRTLKMVCEPL